MKLGRDVRDTGEPICCAICGGKMSPKVRGWACRACAVEFELAGVPFRLWPAWAKYLKAGEERRRRNMALDGID